MSSEPLIPPPSKPQAPTSRRLSMSRLWPHAPYEEDQRLSHPILYAHTLIRGFTMGSAIGLTVPPAALLLRTMHILPASKYVAATFTRQLFRSAGIGAMIGTGLMMVAVPARMRGREEIEWQSRGWRLLENKGQTECDDWMYAGTIGGAVAVALRGQALGFVGAVGGVGVGSVLGAAGYMAYRHGLRGGKWE